MAQALEVVELEAPDAPDTPAPVSEIETRARAMGWKPLDEYRGPQHAWRDAATFVEKGETDLPIMRERNRKLERELEKLSREQGETTIMVRDMTERFRTSEQRAYERAREAIMAEREAAVEAGDTAAFRRAETRLADAEKTAPKPVTVAPANANTPHPEALEWQADNPWFDTDPTLKSVALATHNLLLQREPTLSVRENLAKVTAEVKRRYPEKFTAAAGGFRTVPDDDNPRRNAPSDVAGSTAPRTPGRAEAKSFATLPADSKTQFRRYKKMLEGKGKPITEEEWAAIHYESES